MGAWKFLTADASYYGWDTGVEDQLFNIKDDPYEQNNLAADNPEKVAEMRARALARRLQFLVRGFLLSFL